VSAQANTIHFTRDRNLVGIALFIGSESLFFLAVVIAFVVFREQGLATAKAQLDIGRTTLFSVLLFASSGTMGLAATRRSRLWLGLTALPGAAFLVGQGLEYARLLGAGLRPGSEMFGTTVFTLTGLHAVHVLVGLVLLATLFAASAARTGRVGQTAWEGIAMYWHFVDAVWVVVFSVVYVGTVLG
jgi:heme/copper-type cytochrome/quinol oxidase subunit 3